MPLSYGKQYRAFSQTRLDLFKQILTAQGKHPALRDRTLTTPSELLMYALSDFSTETHAQTTRLMVTSLVVLQSQTRP